MKKKLKLNELNVQSFVTGIDTSSVKGGIATLLDCLSGVYPTLEALGCVTGTNHVNCPCEVVYHQKTRIPCDLLTGM